MSVLLGACKGTVTRTLLLDGYRELASERLGSLGLGKPSLKDLGLPFPLWKEVLAVNPNSSVLLWG